MLINWESPASAQVNRIPAGLQQPSLKRRALAGRKRTVA
jgi:hypothetical protein